MAIQRREITDYSSLYLDALYCEEEEQWVDDQEDEEKEREASNLNNTHVTHDVYATESAPYPLSPPLLDQDLLWDEEELVSLFSKEQETCALCLSPHRSFLSARKEAVNWILKAISYYGFKPLTAILSINYLDRFLSSIHFRKDKPWIIQLAAVSCLSLAAKIDETQLPLLPDLRVGDAGYFLEARNIQRIELLVMSALQWRMNPVTPISFLDHIRRRFGLKSRLHWEFFMLVKKGQLPL